MAALFSGFRGYLPGFLRMLLVRILFPASAEMSDAMFAAFDCRFFVERFVFNISVSRISLGACIEALPICRRKTAPIYALYPESDYSGAASVAVLRQSRCIRSLKRASDFHTVVGDYERRSLRRRLSGFLCPRLQLYSP